MIGVIGDDGDQDTASRVAKVSKNHVGVETLLQSVKAKGNQLHYMVIYLSPGDYHRFHAPAIHTANYRRHIVGYLSPVKPSYVNVHKDVFKHNERVNIFGDWYGRDKNFFFLSYVGALNVGSIVLDFDTDIVTNQTINRRPYFYDKAYTSE
jgi:phosphatidylserine decarboxylase